MRNIEVDNEHFIVLPFSIEQWLPQELQRTNLLRLSLVEDVGEAYGEVCSLGTVKDVLTAGASETYEILGLDGRVHYVPAVEEFVRDIDLDLGRIRISLIEGLWD